MRPQRHRLVDGETGLLAMVFHHLRRWKSSAREYLGDHEFDEPEHRERKGFAAREELVGVIADVALDGHPPVVGQDGKAVLEEVVVALEPEMLKRLDGQDAVNGFVELLPAAQQHPAAAVRFDLIEQPNAGRVLVSAQRQTDDVHVVTLDRPLHGGAPATADVEHGHSRLQVQLVQVEVDLRELSLFQGQVLGLEIGAAIDAAGFLEQPEEVIREVIVRVDVLKVPPHLL
jgi:hypothetical protein